MNLSPRLRLIADMTEGDSVADIGTDHGKLVIELVSAGRAAYAVASDVGKGPVSACSRNVKLAGLSGRIQIRLGNGLETLEKDEVKTIVIAGMGGELISEILGAGSDKITCKTQLVLQPMTGAEHLRIYLSENGYVICDEKIAVEDDKIYTVMSVYKGEAKPVYGIESIVSDALFKHKDENLIKYLQLHLQRLSKKLIGLKKAANPDEAAVLQTERLVKAMEEKYEFAKNS